MAELVVVSGGTKGIGNAIVRKFAENGYDIATCSRNAEDLDALKTELNTNFPNVNVFVQACDLSNKDAVIEFAQFVQSLNSRLFALINNVGTFYPGSIMEEEDGVLEKSLSLNLNSIYYLTRELGKPMVQARSGIIFNICSTAGITAYLAGASYCISKHALIGFSKVLREEMKSQGVKVTTVIPGSTYTPSWQESDLSEDKFIRPSDIADSVYTCSQLSENSVMEELVIRPQGGDV